MRFLVTGSRNWPNDPGRGYEELIREQLYKLPDDWLLIQGYADGVDRIAFDWWMHLERDAVCVPAKWNKFHRAAGPIRNQQMLDDWKPEVVIAFFKNVEKSRGTRDMVNRAAASGIPLKQIVALKLDGDYLASLDDVDWEIILRGKRKAPTTV